MSEERSASQAQAERPASGAWFPCPYCGERQASGSAECGACGGLFEPLSRQATQNQMGPWFVRDPAAPFVPGRSYSTIRRMAQRGKITPETVVRGPTTRQFWMAASEVQGVAHLLGRCHACKAPAKADDFSCESCGAAFSAPDDRQTLGLAPVRLLPGQAPPALVARAATGPGASPVGSATAFTTLAGSAGAVASDARAGDPRPSVPAPLTPAGGSIVSSQPAPTAAHEAQAEAEAPAEIAALRRSLRIASRRVAALRNLVVLLAIVNVIVLAVLLAVALGGEASPASAPAGSGEDVPADPESSG
jgi:predicted RNA-binding Zn-ribbon protein involved in translation (DUF1610 family)